MAEQEISETIKKIAKQLNKRIDSINTATEDLITDIGPVLKYIQSLELEIKTLKKQIVPIESKTTT